MQATAKVATPARVSEYEQVAGGLSSHRTGELLRIGSARQLRNLLKVGKLERSGKHLYSLSSVHAEMLRRVREGELPPEYLAVWELVYEKAAMASPH